MPDSKDRIPEIHFSFAPPKTIEGHIHQGYLTELWERGATVVNGEVVTNVEDLHLALRKQQLLQKHE